MLVPLYALHLGADTMQISLLVACYSLMPLLCSMATGRLCDRIGNRIPICLSSICCGISLGLPAVMNGSLSVIAASQIAFGLGHVIFQVSTQNLLGKVSNGENRTNQFGILSVVMSAGNITAPLLVGGLIEAGGYRRSYSLCSIFSVIAFLLTLSLFSRPLESRLTSKCKKNREKPGSLISTDLLRHRDMKKMLLTSATIMTGTTLFSFYIPLYGSYLGHSTRTIGFFSSVYAAAFFVVRMFFPFLLKRFTHKQVLAYALLLAGGSYMLLPLFRGATGIIGICFFIGLGLGCGYPITMSMAYNAAPPGRSGEVLGMRLMANRLTQLCLPALTGFLTASIAMVFVSLGIFLSGSSVAYFKSSKTIEKSEH